ncbi:MAG: VOC family protein [Christensenellaceae bacterium]|jgi:catechol 2,3-dioxygenase-like lactoylglutathione lyase family enzyme
MSLQLENICVVLDSGNAEELALFYQKLLGWEKYGAKPEDEYLAVVSIEKPGLPGLIFQEVEDYIPPVWPDAADAQRQMVHLDFHVEDVAEGVAHALACGATLSPVQTDASFQVLFDPAGHPFCICPRIFPAE